MKEYKIQVTETISIIVGVTAVSAQMAERIVKRRYRDGEVGLDYSDATIVYSDYDYVNFDLIED